MPERAWGKSQHPINENPFPYHPLGFRPRALRKNFFPRLDFTLKISFRMTFQTMIFEGDG